MSSGKMSTEQGVIDQLPVNVLEQIFLNCNAEQLDKVGLVCRRWNTVVSTSHLLQDKFHLKFKQETLDQTHAVGRDRPASTITFARCRIVATHPWWPPLAERVTHVNIRDCRVSYATLFRLLRHAQNLRRLKLCMNQLDGTQNVDLGFQLSKMEELSLIFMENDFRILRLFRGMFPRLRRFELEYFDVLGEEDTIYGNVVQFLRSAQKTLEEVHLNVPSSVLVQICNLKQLKLKKLSYAWTEESLPFGVQMEKFCQYQPFLTEISVLLNPITNKSLCEISKHLPWLTSAQIYVQSDKGELVPTFLNSMTGLTSLLMRLDSVPVNFNGCESPNLEVLTLSNAHCTKNSLNAYFRNAPKLRVLRLNRSWHASWKDIFASIGQLKSLQSLKMHGCTVEGSDGCKDIDSWEDVFSSIVQLESLQCLDMHDCTVESIEGDFSVERRSKLGSLLLSQCILSKSTLIDLFEVCPQLKKVHLASLQYFDDDVMLAMCKTLQQLKELTLIRCAAVTDASLDHIAQSCRTMTNLIVQNCDRVSSDAVVAFRNHVNITNIEQIDSDDDSEGETDDDFL